MASKARVSKMGLEFEFRESMQYHWGLEACGAVKNHSAGAQAFWLLVHSTKELHIL